MIYLYYYQQDLSISLMQNTYLGIVYNDFVLRIRGMGPCLQIYYLIDLFRVRRRYLNILENTEFLPLFWWQRLPQSGHRKTRNWVPRQSHHCSPGGYRNLEFGILRTECPTKWIEVSPGRRSLISPPRKSGAVLLFWMQRFQWFQSSWGSHECLRW